MKPTLKLIVLRCADIEVTKTFYEKLGLSFQRDKHGKGLEHYSTDLDGLILELYPATAKYAVDSCRLGFSGSVDVSKLDASIVFSYESEKGRVVVQDPDGRKVEYCLI